MLSGALLCGACGKGDADRTDRPSAAGLPIRVEPVITRATETDFENGDAIGLTVSRESGVYATNEKLVFDGTSFGGSLVWYAEGADVASLSAYSPWQESGVPTSFTVQADQTAGTSSSDFLAASKTGVIPSANAVAMVFQHRLTRLVIKVQNNTGKTITGITVGGARLAAKLSEDFTATVDPSAAVTPVKARNAAEKTWHAILPPQTVSLSVKVESELSLPVQYLAEAQLQGGKQYSVGIVVNPDGLKVTLSGAIDNWEDGGELEPGGNPPAADFEEHLDQNKFIYHGTTYKVVKMKDGKWWMAQNLAYLPEGKTASADLSAVTAGIFAPLRINEAQTAAEFTTDAAVVTSNGYLYQAEAALGLEVGAITTLDQAVALEGAQGLCPPGWHVPTLADIRGLVGKIPQQTAVTTPYFDGSECYMDALNADGFNMAAFGMVSILDNTRTSGSITGFMSSYKDHLCSGMFCGSSVGRVDGSDTPTATYNTAGDPASGIKNLQFYGFMPMTNKASSSQYTCNGTKVSYRIAAPLRCVRNKAE